jgi:thioredoxin 2
MMAPAFEQNATHFGQKVRFVKVNTEEEQQIAAHYGIRSIPTMILFKDGKEADRVSGALPAEQMKSWIAQRI